MQRVLIVECMQEISSFNPLLSDYDHFAIQYDDEILRQAGPALRQCAGLDAGPTAVLTYDNAAPTTGAASRRIHQ
jgi:hypothetical protein